ncbi:glycosyltransferase [Tepidibacillus sp. LV47]|uniref:glycosyltransferase n=1 Tax=Tepidibacillus sp. LV47 TaxID=3398228 RepID=UPI003AAD5A02
MLKSNPKILYIDNNGNQGIAHALNVGAKRANEEGYEWLLTMDQDSRFDPDMFKKYINCLNMISNSKEIAIISPNYLTNTKIETSCSFKEKLTTITSGSLLNLLLYTNIGGFNEKLFIDEVDHDYCLRANLKNYGVVELENIFMHHKLGNLDLIKRWENINM